MSAINEEIRRIGYRILEQLMQKKAPVLEFPKRSRDNVRFENGYLKLGQKLVRRRMNDITEVKKFAQTLAILKIINELIEKDTFLNIRGIYYCPDNVQIPGTKHFLFDEQTESDSVLTDVEVLLGKFREELHIASNSKGHVVGDVKFKAYTKTKEYIIDCTKVGPEGAKIPRDLSRLEIVECNANFVLVIEKDDICFGLNYDEFWEKYNCILLTAEGVPDRATRLFVRQLNEKFKIPVAVLVDNDPYGWGNIYAVYKYGSIRLAHDSERLACPNAQLVGLVTSDIERWKLSPKTLEDATESDIEKAKQLKEYEWFKDEFWQRELDLFLKIKKKTKIDALAEHDYRFLQDVYLPQRLKEMGLI
jgi:DNA topoisomerase-6 subunit A